MIKRILSERFSKNGFDYALVKRSGDVCLYEQSKLGKVYGYETALIRTLDVKNGFLGSGITKYERYPSNEEFGKYGFSYQELDNAEIGYQTLLQNQRIRCRGSDFRADMS